MADFKIEEDKKEQYQKVIHDEVNHMNQLILDLLELSKIESSELQLEKNEIYLADIIDDVKLANELKLKEKKISFKTSVSNEVVIADKKMITLIFSNIISNAIKAVDYEGTIDIRIEMHKGKYRISILNDGKPLDNNEVLYLFNPKYSYQKNGDNTLLSSGLGLSLTKAILKLYTNDYGADNIDGLVCFWFTLIPR